MVRSNFLYANTSWKNNILLEVRVFSNINDCIKEAIEFAKAVKGYNVYFRFHDITVLVQSDSVAELIYRDWQRCLDGYIDDKVIGPYTKPFLTKEDIEHDERILAEAKAAAKIRVEIDNLNRKKELENKRNVLKAELMNIPAMEFLSEDRDGWQRFFDYKNQLEGLEDGGLRDWYEDGSLMVYAERWARLMQVEIKNNKSFDKFFSETSEKAMLEDHSGLQHDKIVFALVKFWKYGEQLRCWYNLKNQMKDMAKRLMSLTRF